MGEQKTIFSEEELIRIKEYFDKHYIPDESYREEDEIQQKMDVLEESLGIVGKDPTKMYVATSLPPSERMLVTINEMARMSGMGHNSIREFVRRNPNSECLFRVGNRVYLKREMFYEVLRVQSSL